MRSMKTYVVAAATAVALSAAAGYAQNQQSQQPAQMNHQAMMANMQAQQKKLDDLVAQMNAAKGQDKVDKIAAVVNEMAAMHKRMSGMMMMMHGGGAGQMPHDQHHQNP